MSFAHSLVETLGPLKYSALYEKDVKALRERLSGGLCIDRLLTYAGVSNPEEQYPPGNRELFLRLVDAIESATSNKQYQSRALYFLFLDFSEHNKQQSHEQTTTVAEYYASQIWMSKPEVSLVKGLWYLDHGNPDAALLHLGQPWNLDGADALHESIVDSLSIQKPEAVASYLSARGPSNTHSEQLVKSLAIRGKFAEVLDIAREQQNLEFLKEISHASVDSKQKSMELAQLPCTPAEWEIIQDELRRLLTTASGASDTAHAAARNIILVRALHTGDVETLMELRSGSSGSDLYSQSFLS